MSIFRRAMWGKKRRGEETELRLKTSPRLASITLDRFETVCALIDMDPDKILRGEVQLSDMRTPPLTRLRDLMAAMCENATEVDIGSMDPRHAQAVVAVVLANFLMDSVVSLQLPSPTGRD